MLTSPYRRHPTAERSFYVVWNSLEPFHFHTAGVSIPERKDWWYLCMLFLADVHPLKLDEMTNYPYLYLISENRRMRPSPSRAAAHPYRFTRFPQVLCREGLSERCYWEVEGHARTLSAAVAYKDIGRTSDESRFGKNDKSWSLECAADGYLFCHNNVEIKVPGSGLHRIGVFLDYKAGTLSFYRASDPMVLIHKVQTAFTQPLYPGVGINYEWYDVGVFAQLVKMWWIISSDWDAVKQKTPKSIRKK